MKHIQLFESFINEAKLKAGRDEPVAKALIAFRYAVEGTEEAERIKELGLNPMRSDMQVTQVGEITGWTKDAVRVLSGARTIPTRYSIGTIITLAADNGNTYYFDDVDFVENDKTIIPNGLQLTWTQFIDELIKLKVIDKPTYN